MKTSNLSNPVANETRPHRYVLRVVVFEDSLIVEFGTDRLIWGFHFADKVVGRFEGEMSEVFEGYERQYCELSANLSASQLPLFSNLYGSSCQYPIQCRNIYS